MHWIDVLQIVSIIFTTIVSLCFAHQIIYLFVPFIVKPKAHKEEKLHKYAVMIAARNEEAVLPHLIKSIKDQDYPAELVDIYVVADNCTDGTARVSRACGATVFERFNKEQIGKGYALDYLIGNIAQNGGLERYDAFMVFDADNLLDRKFMRNINQTLSDGYRVFCGCRGSKNFGTNWITSGYGHWFLRESALMNRARTLVGASSIVNGTGFGFTREVLEKVGGWKFFTLSEDTEFCAWCATNGIQVGYCHEALFFDEQPAGFRDSLRQRVRWLQGGMEVSFKYTGRLLKNIFKFKRHSWYCFEIFTLTFWGCAAGVLAMLMSVFIGTVNGGVSGLILTVLSIAFNTYTLLMFNGLLIVLAEWDRIIATKKEKVVSIFTYPLFMLTFVIAAVMAVFIKPQWSPIAHTVAVSSDELQK